MPRSPAAMRDRYRRIVYRYRNVPGLHGLRPHTVEVRVRTWTGSHTGDGTASGSWASVVESGGQSPKVRWLKQEEIALGNLQDGTAEIGPITPDFSGGGTALTTLIGDSADTGNEFHVRITGPEHPNGALYKVVQAHGESALHLMLIVSPVAAS